MSALPPNLHLGAPAEHDPFAGPELAAFVPVSASQSEVWLAALMSPEANLSFNEGIHLHLKGALNVPALQQALQTVINRHEALRGSISPDGLSMLVRAELPLPLPPVDVSAEPDPQAALAAIEHREMATEFDLEAGPLVRATLVQTAPESHHLLLIAHHVVCDGWSGAVLMTELAALYSAAVEGKEPALEAPARYGDYSVIEREFLASDIGRRNEAWWLAKLADAPPVFDLPTDRPRPVPRAYTASRIDLPLDAELTQALRKTAAQQGASLVTVMMATFAVLVHRLTEAEDVIIGLDSAGQLTHDQLKLVGHCVNKMPLRLKPQGALRFSEFLKVARSEILDAQDHQGITYGTLIPKLPLQRDDSRPLLIAVTFNIDVRDDDITHRGLEASYSTMVRQADNQELFINVVDNGHDLLLETSYNSAIFNADTVARRIGEYTTLLTAITRDAQQRIADLPLVSPAEATWLTETLNATRHEWPQQQPIHRWVEDQARKTPDATAVIASDATLSYAELNQRANQLAHWLCQQGVAADAPVAVCLPRSARALVALLATLKAGGAYLPLDPEYPLERLRYLVDDAQPKVLLTAAEGDPESLFTAEARQQLAAAAGQHLDLVEHWAEQVAALPSDNRAEAAALQDLAYVIYTSGSTGKPKGTRLPHAGPVNQYLHYIEALDITPSTRMLVFTSLAFDLTQRNLWAPLMAGGTVVFAKGAAYDPAAIVDTLEREAITHLCCTPSAFYPLLQESAAKDPSAAFARLKSLRQLALGGEALQMSRLSAWRESPHCQAHLTNCYGPTEASANVAMFHLRHGEPAGNEGLPIGRPIRNVVLHVLDRAGNVLPVGAEGELHIGGVQLARDYLGRPELTAERFMEHPRLGRLYRTGDRARRLPDGQLEYLGRIDFQVKLRGFRVELGEIEAALHEHPEVAEAVVGLLERSPGDVRLVAWVVAKDTTLPVNSSSLRNALRQALPDYMVPQQFVSLEALPLTPNGKLDRQRLPNPFVQQSAAEAKTPPRNAAEQAVADIWAELLGVSGISIDDRFGDLGGHSLLAVQASARLQARFGVKPALRGLMSNPLSAIAQELGGAALTAPAPAAPQAAAAKPAAASPRARGPAPAAAADLSAVVVPARATPSKKSSSWLGRLLGG